MTDTTPRHIGIALEVSPLARRERWAYVHGTQLEAPLSIGQRVAFDDEGGNVMTAEVVDASHDRLGPRYLLRLDD